MSKKQIIILFSLFTAIAVLVVALLVNLNQSNDKNSDDQGAGQGSVLETIQEDFQDTVEQTDSQDELDFFEDITQNQLDDIPVNENNNEIVDVQEFVTRSQYDTIVNDIDVYRNDPLDISVLVPDTGDVFDDNVVNTFSDGSRILYFDYDDAPEIQGLSLLKNDLNRSNYSVAYIQKDDIFISLGRNVANIFEYTIDGEELWVTILYNQTRFNDVYISKPFFKELNYVENLYFLIESPKQMFKNGNDLIVDTHVEGFGFGSEEDHSVKLTIDIEGIVKAPAGTDIVAEYVTSDFGN